MAINVQAAVFHGPGRPLTIETLQLDPPQSGEVMVRIVATGLCHTDLHIMEGHQPQAVPAVLGHESAGVIVAVGPDVTGLDIGDHVVPFMLPECAVCPNCLSGRTNICLKVKERTSPASSRLHWQGRPVHTFAGMGTFADHMVITADRVAKVSKAARFDGACYASCGGATGIGTVRHMGVDADSLVAVFGLGGIGLNMVQSARQLGAKTIIGIDTNDAKEAVARRMGATHFINPARQDSVPAAIMAITGMGATHSFECVGSPSVMRQAVDATNPFYGRCTLVGVAAAGAELSLPIQGLSMGKTVGGLLMGGLKPRSQLPGLVQEYAEGRLNFDALISHRLPLDLINEGFALMKRGEVLRAVILFDGTIRNSAGPQ